MAKPAPRAENAGRPDYQELEKQQRVQHSKTRGFDSLPNPVVDTPNGPQNRGHVKNPDAPEWRVGLTAEKYYGLTLKFLDQKARGKKDDFRPELQTEEYEDYQKYLKDNKLADPEKPVEVK